ncbi:MAG: ABC transporter ATP-binding protein [Deltaproteobacteria bacterium]|nr:ABC transporter ATP-binding protein [Deltaproteobacteria bacterium]
MLEVIQLIKRFGGLIAVNNLSMHVEKNKILGVIGPNGSGKTTLLNCINGLYKPEKGRILLNGKEIQGLLPHEIAKIGIGRTFQVPKIFKRMTVMENLLAPVLSSELSDKELKEIARKFLSQVNLLDHENELGEELSGGQQKLLELVRIMMFNPDLLLLDEPFAGVHPTLKAMFYERIMELKESGKTFILVSHDINSIYTLCDQIIVLDRGEKIAYGKPEDIRKNERVIEAYLGR